MSASFVNSLRSRPGVLALGDTGSGALRVRVEIPELWDTVRVDAAPGTTVRALKVSTLGALSPDTRDAALFVMKLGGFELLDEDACLADVGATDGSIFLLTHRYRRPVRRG